MMISDAKGEKIAPITAQTEMLQCGRCGCIYPSKGKSDTGYCRDCQKTINAILKGGPLDGMRHSGLLEDEE